MDSNKILFATDFEPQALQILAQVELLASPPPAHVLLMHVPSTWRAWLSSGLTERQAEDRLRGWGEKLQAKGITVDVLVHRGSAAERIIETADAFGADLIVVGAGEHWQQRHEVGTTAIAVVSYTRRSVWVGVPTQGPPQNILCGFDGSERGQEALQKAIGIGQQLGAQVTIVGAIDGPDENLLGTSPEEERRRLEDYKGERCQELERALSAVAGASELERRWLWGRGSDALRAKAEDDGADLIVLGRTGVSDVRRALLGATAERLLRNTPCSLYVVGSHPSDPR